MDQFYQTPQPLQAQAPNRRKYYDIAVAALIIAIVAMLAYYYKDAIISLFSRAGDQAQLTWGGEHQVHPFYPCLAPVRTTPNQTGGFVFDTENRLNLFNKGTAPSGEVNVQVNLNIQGEPAQFTANEVTVSTGTYANGVWTIPSIAVGEAARIKIKRNNMPAVPFTVGLSGGESISTECKDSSYFEFVDPASAPVAAKTAEPAKEAEPTPASAITTTTEVPTDTTQQDPAPVPVDNTDGDLDPPTPPPAECADTLAEMNTIGASYRVFKNTAVVSILTNGCGKFTFGINSLGTNQEILPYNEQQVVSSQVFELGFGTHYLTLPVNFSVQPLSCGFQSDLYLPISPTENQILAYDWAERGCVVTPPPPPPQALTCAPANETIAVGQTARFTSTYNGQGLSYIWSAPGGTPDTGLADTFQTTYSTTGTKTVTVSVGGLTANCAVVVTAGPSPTNLTCSPTPVSGKPGDTIEFTAAGGDGNYLWSSTGDNPTKPPTGPKASFTFGTAGNYEVTVTSNSGNLSAKCAVTISAETNVTLTCSPTTQNAQVGVLVRFTSTYNGQGLSYIWSAPGGTPDTGLADTFQTTYSSIGSKTVTVSVGGLTATCNVAVAEAPVALSCDPPSQTTEVNKEVSFTATGGNGTYSWQVVNDNTANPLTGTGATFKTVFTTPNGLGIAAKIVRVTSGGASDDCGVTVNPATSTDPNADLAIQKTVNNSTPRVGDQVIYTLVITNNGPNDATGVVVNDVVPSGVSYLIPQPTGSQPNPSNGTANYDQVTKAIRWNVGALGANRNATYFFTVTVNQGGTITNTATIEPGSLPDPVSSNNTSSVIITPSTGGGGGGDTTYDVGIEKTVSNSSPRVGDSVQFTITATNTRSTTVTGVVVHDSLPNDLTYESHTVSAGTYSQSTGDWTIGTLTGGASVTLRITATPNASGSITNTAELDDIDQNDNNSSNNEDSVTITASSGGGGGGGSSSTDLAVSKTVSNTTPSVGQQVTYTITVFNNGPRDASSAVIKDVLPAGVTYVSSSTANGSYNQSNGRWTIDDLDEGETATLQIVAVVNQIGTITNTAELTDSTPNDNESDNDEDSVTITVGNGGGGSNGPDVSVIKTVNNDRPVVGGQITYVINVANRGSTALTGLTIEDKLPSQVRFVKVQTSTGSYDKNTGIWTIGTLASGSGAVMHITVSVLKVDTFTNLARLNTVDQNDSDTTNNQSQVTVTSRVVPGLPAAGFNTAAPIVIGFLFILLAFVVHFLGGTKRKVIAAQNTDI